MAGTPTVYVICDQNCKFEGMTKEQILTAIAQAVESGEIKDVDAGFITTIKTINNIPLKFFVGEQAAFDALSDEEKNNLFAIITNDTTKEGLEEAIKVINETIKNIFDGKLTVPKAEDATNAKYASWLDPFKTTAKFPVAPQAQELNIELMWGKTYLIKYAGTCFILSLPTESDAKAQYKAIEDATGTELTEYPALSSVGTLGGNAMLYIQYYKKFSGVGSKMTVKAYDGSNWATYTGSSYAALYNIQYPVEIIEITR